jgi:hypothetical protein
MAISPFHVDQLTPVDSNLTIAFDTSLIESIKQTLYYQTKNLNVIKMKNYIHKSFENINKIKKIAVRKKKFSPIIVACVYTFNVEYERVEIKKTCNRYHQSVVSDI